MVILLLERWAEALGDPRASARRILSARPSGGEAVAMAVAGVALGLAAIRAVELILGVSVLEAGASLGGQTAPSRDLAEAVERARSLGGLLEQFLMEMLEFLVIATLGWRIGRMAGGGASFNQIFALSGWLSLAAAPLQVAAQTLLILTAPSLAAVGWLAMVGGAVYVIYMMAAFLAEAHGFESTGQVMVASFGVMFGLGLLVLVLASIAGLSPAGA